MPPVVELGVPLGGGLFQRHCVAPVSGLKDFRNGARLSKSLERSASTWIHAIQECTPAAEPAGCGVCRNSRRDRQARRPSAASAAYRASSPERATPERRTPELRRRRLRTKAIGE